MKRFLLALLLSTSGSLSHATGNATPIAQNPCKAGIDLYEEEKFESAIRQLSICLDQDLPARIKSLALQVRANSQFGLKKYDLALKDQLTSINLVPPTDAWTYIMLGVYYREANQYELALDALKKTATLDEDGPGSGPGMAVYYHTGQTLERLGKYSDAVNSYTLGIARQPDFGPAIYRRGLCYEALGEKQQAKRDFFRASQLPPPEGYKDEVKSKFSEYGL